MARTKIRVNQFMENSIDGSKISPDTMVKRPEGLSNMYVVPYESEAQSKKTK